MSFRSRRRDGPAGRGEWGADGYATRSCRFEELGDYLVSVQRKNDRSESATVRLELQVA